MRRIRLTEEQLNRVIYNSAKRLIQEANPNMYGPLNNQNDRDSIINANQNRYYKKMRDSIGANQTNVNQPRYAQSVPNTNSGSLNNRNNITNNTNQTSNANVNNGVSNAQAQQNPVAQQKQNLIQSAFNMFNKSGMQQMARLTYHEPDANTLYFYVKPTNAQQMNNANAMYNQPLFYIRIRQNRNGQVYAQYADQMTKRYKNININQIIPTMQNFISMATKSSSIGPRQFSNIIR